METLEVEAPFTHPTPTVSSNGKVDENAATATEDDDEISPIEEVRLTVPVTDDPNLSVWTFRMWVLGLFSCVIISFLNQFFSYRYGNSILISEITVIVAALPVGRFMADVLPTTKWALRFPGFGRREFSLNPGPFNVKEHVLISIFASTASTKYGPSISVMIVDIILAFSGRKISFLAGWLLIITTQVLGYGWAGLLRKYVIEPAHMWWPNTLVQVSLFRTLHEKEDPNIVENVDGSVNKRQMSRSKFFLIAFFCSFFWCLFPSYLFQALQSISWVCWVFPHSVTAHQIGSGRHGLGVGALTLDWSHIAGLSSPFISPFFVIANIFLGYFVMTYIVIPISYWVLNVYNAKTFPLSSVHWFTVNGQEYNRSAIVDQKLQLDIEQYQKQGRIHLSLVFSLAFGFGLATLASTVTHVALFYGREIYERYRASSKVEKDIHTTLMKSYEDVPSWWFYFLLAVTMVVSISLCIFLKKEIQMPFWAFLLATALAFSFTLPISIITATTNQTPGLNVITEHIMGVIYPGRPIANVCFKVYGCISMFRAIAFLSDFKLGHYMKIPPRSIFLVQLLGTIIASTVTMIVAWWLLHLDGMCHPDEFSNGPWTCPNDQLIFNSSIIWGLIGSKRIFGLALNWFFLAGLLAPIVIWGCHKAFPKHSWIPLINLPVILGVAPNMLGAFALRYNSWILIGTIFNFFVFRYRKKWWQRYNYILSAALDAGVTFMVVFLYFTVGIENTTISWWGNNDLEHCDLASCPTAKGIIVDGCPVF